MKNTKLLLILGITLGLVAPIQAGEIKAEWKEPKEFRDLRAADGFDKRFHKKFIEDFDKFFAKVQSELPEDVKVEFKFTDVDLAGRIDFGSSFDRVRLVEHQYWPRMEFEVVMYKGNNKVYQDTVSVKDMAFMDRAPAIQYRSFGYEKRMLKEWIDSELTDKLAQYEKSQNDVMENG